MELTYDAYLGFLAGLRDRGYRSVPFGPPDDMPAPSEPVVLLHHDVDLDLDRAVAMAEREHAAGWSATYFVLLTSPFYNPASAPGRARLRELVGLGHRVGLHFDPTVHDVTDAGSFRRACLAEVETLGGLVGTDVEIVSFHRPAPDLVGGDAELTRPLPHTYLPYYVEQVEYCTDSTGRWRFGPPEERAAVREGRALHLLTHPIWWDDAPMAAEDRLGRFLADQSSERAAAVARELAVDPRGAGR